MEIPQVDGNQEDQEKIDKKIIGRGFRPALKTPKNFPYPLELDESSQSFALDFDEKRNQLNIRDIKQASTAFVEIHPRGLRFVFNEKKYIIPGELSLAKTVDILAIEYSLIKQIADDSDIIGKFNHENTNIFLTDLSFISDLNQDAEKQIKLLPLKHRKREIAGALLANGLWQKRGFVDKEKIAPKNFWQVVPSEELMIGNKHNLKRWWEDALAHSAIELTRVKNNRLKTYLNSEFERAMEIKTLVCNKDYLTEKDYAAKIKSYQVHEIIEINAHLKPIRDKIKEGFLPEYPWEIRHWDKISFEPLKKALLYGLHKMPEWEAYTKSGAPQIEGVIDLLQYKIFEKNIYDIKTSSGIQQEIKEYYENKLKREDVFSQPFEDVSSKPFEKEIEEKIRQSLALFTEGKILEGKSILTQRILRIQDKNGEYYNLWDTKTPDICKEILVEREDFLDIFKEERKNQFVIPNFACANGWKWDENKISFIALSIIRDEEKNYYFCSKNSPNQEEIERNRINNADSLKCIAIKNENGIQKEAVLRFHSLNKNWYAMRYLSCDITDLREINIFCRTLDVVKYKLEPKINSNSDKITTDIYKEKVIENSLLSKSIAQSNKMGGR